MPAVWTRARPVFTLVQLSAHYRFRAPIFIPPPFFSFFSSPPLPLPILSPRTHVRYYRRAVFPYLLSWFFFFLFLFLFGVYNKRIIIGFIYLLLLLFFFFVYFIVGIVVGRYPFGCGLSADLSTTVRTVRVATTVAAPILLRAVRISAPDKTSPSTNHYNGVSR